MRDYEREQHKRADKKNGRMNQVRPKMIDPSAHDSWDHEHERNGEAALPIGDSKYRSDQDQRK
jgi:hypothetical protein